MTLLDREENISPEGMWNLLLALAIAFTSGSCIWPFFFPESLRYLTTNKVSSEFPAQLFYIHLCCAAVLLAIYLGYALAHKKQQTLLESVRVLNRRLVIILAAPCLTFLLSSGVEKHTPFITLILSVFVAFLFATWRPLRALTSSISNRLHSTHCTILAIVLCFMAAAIYSYLSIWGFRSGILPSFDLAIYVNLVSNTANGNFLGSAFHKGGSHMSSHFDPILTLLVPLFEVAPGPDTLLIVQGASLALGGLLLFFSSRRLLGAASALAISSLYYLYPAVHGVNFYEFHSVALAVPFYSLLLYSFFARRPLLFWISVLLTALTREDLSIINAIIGLYLIVFERAQFKRGLALLVFSIGYLTIVKSFFMYDSSLLMQGQDDYRLWFEELLPYKGQGIKVLIYTLITNPIFALKVILKEEKALYFLLMFLPVGFMPFFSGRKMLLLSYGLIFSLLSTRMGPHSVMKQYNSFFLPFIWFLAPFGIARVLHFQKSTKQKLKFSIITFVAVLSALISIKFGGIIPNRYFRSAAWRKPFHFRTSSERQKIKEKYSLLQEIVPLVPREAAVYSSRTLLPYFAARPNIVRHPRSHKAKLLVIDGKLKLDEKTDEHFKDHISKGRLKVVQRSGQYTLYCRSDYCDKVSLKRAGNK